MITKSQQNKETEGNRGKKVINVIDFFALWGAGITYVLLSPKLFAFSSFGFMLYFFFRFYHENSRWKKWAFLVIAFFCGTLGIYTLYDQSSLVRINVTLTDSGKQYYTGDEVYESDFSVVAIKKNGKELPVEVFDVSPTTLKKGNNIFTVSYKGLESNITINAIDPYVEYLEVKCVKEKFFVGDKISKKDFNVVGVDSKGNRSIIADYTFAPAEVLSAGENKITFIYEIAEGEVIINAFKHEIIKIEAEYIGKEPLYVGDSIQSKNLNIVGIYDNDARKKLKDFVLKNSELTKVGDNNITIEYKGFTTIVNVVAHGIVSIEAECTNKLLFEGDSITKNDLTVYGVYDTNDKEELVDFDFSIVREEETDVDDNIVLKGDNTITIKYGDLSTELIVYVNEAPDGNVSLNDRWASFYLEDWDPALDFDINGLRHENGGKKIIISDIWHGIDSNASSSDVEATWFVPLRPSQTEAGNTFSGVFVLDYSAKSSGSTVKITIKAGEGKYTFGPLDSEPVPFNINIENLDSLEIVFECTIKGEGLVFGMLNE